MLPVMPRIPKPSSSVRPNASSQRKYPFSEMDVGDWFFVPGLSKNTLSTLASLTGKKLGRLFSTRLLYVADCKEVAAGTAGAVLGVGVWRDA
jgi:hypothetical protein